jgi:hypothetical protein
MQCTKQPTQKNKKKKRQEETGEGKEDLRRPNSLTFLILSDNTLSVALFNYNKLCTLASIVTLLTTFTVVKQWFQLWDPLLHKNSSNYHKRMVYTDGQTDRATGDLISLLFIFKCR